MSPVIMELTFGDVLDKAILFVTVAAFGALFLVYGTTKTLRDSNNDLRDQHEDDKERLEGAQKENDELRKKIVTLESRISVLEGLVTGAVNWAAISDQLESHHREAVAHWGKTMDQWVSDERVLNEIRDELTTLNQRLGEDDE